MEVKLSSIINNRNILSPSNYKITEIKAPIIYKLSELIDKPDKGIEIGSNNYVEKSNYKFIRTSAFSSDRFCLVIDNNSILNISSNAFADMHLKKYDILICKDSNVGETVMLDSDFPNYMFSSGINRLNVKKDKFYILGIMKNENFKNQLISKIPKGATIMHARDLYLECLIPYSNNNKITEYVSSLTEIIFNREIEIKKRFEDINDIINNELNKIDESKIQHTKFPTISQLITSTRLDTGNYTEEFNKIDSQIKSYKNGYYYIDKNNIHGGNTPKKRAITKDSSGKFIWIIPTYIDSNGTINLSNRIDCQKNNINKNSMLIVNRTSKGGIGEYVGIASFYDYKKYGKAQNNQGLYRIDNYSDQDLILMTALLNSPMYRKYCANLSMGSKMKELKLNNIISIPFPKFPENIKNQICNLYYNKINKIEVNEKNFVLENSKWDKKAGLLDLYESNIETKKILNKIVDNIYLNEDFKIEYKIF